MPPAAAQNFSPYYTQSQLLDSHVIKGTLHVNPKCPSDAFVRMSAPYMLPDDIGAPESCLAQAMTDDIFIRGPQHRNRAIQGDIVYVIILPLAQWSYDRAMMDKDHRNDEDDPQEPLLPGIPCGRIVYIVDRANLPVFCVLRSQFYATDMTPEDELIFDPRKTNRFRAIPLDKRFPWFLVEAKPFLQQFGKYITSTLKKVENADGTIREDIVKCLPEYTVFKIKFKDWQASDRLPKGLVTEVKGDCLNFEFEESLALETNDIAEFADPLSREVESWAVARVQEIQKNFEAIAGQRKDLRHLNVISIDPATARDLDDACHIRRLSPDEIQQRGGGHKHVLEVGVHIADVSFVITPGSPPDLEGSKRTTTVYLPHKAFHMLPRSVCQDLCSLNASSDKLAYSVIAYFDEDTMELINNGTQWKGKFAPQYFKSVIRNKARLNYDQVQDLLDTTEGLAAERTATSTLVGLAVTEGQASTIETSLDYPISKLTEDVRLMFRVARKLRTSRFAEGSVNLSSVQLRFVCSEYMPTSILEEIHSESHWLIEEWMLLANQLVAQRLYSSPVGENTALLRVHSPIEPKKRGALLKRLSQARIPCSAADFATAGALSSFLKNLYKTQSHCKAKMVEMLIIMSFEQAHYEWASAHKPTRHFALGFELYTHFTSPIRRYADLLVHRQLELVTRFQNEKNCVDLLLEELKKLQVDPHLEKGEVRVQERQIVLEKEEQDTSMLGRINLIRMSAKRAGEKASTAWLLMFLLKLPEPHTSRCVVAEIADRSFSVHISELFNFVRVEFEVSRRGDTNRLKRKVRPQHLEAIAVPDQYTLLDADDTVIDPKALPEDNEGQRSVLNNAKVQIKWENNKQVKLRAFDELDVWVIPSRDVPIGLVVVPVPPNHKHNSPKVSEKTIKTTGFDDILSE